MEAQAPRTPEEDTETAGTPTSVDEINAVPEPTHIAHDTPEDLMSDKSVAPEGHNHEHADPTEVEPLATDDVESSAEVHEPQADGTPDGEASPTTDDAS